MDGETLILQGERVSSLILGWCLVCSFGFFRWKRGTHLKANRKEGPGVWRGLLWACLLGSSLAGPGLAASKKALPKGRLVDMP